MILSSQQIELLTYMKGIFKPKPHLTGSQWMDKYFYLSPESSAKPGKWTSLPWQREILDAMTDFESKIVVMQKPTRVGFTKMGNGAKAYFIHQQPCVILDYQPTDDEAKGYAEDEFETMVRDNKVISDLIETPNIRGRVKREKTIKKFFPKGFIEMLGAESDRNLNRRTARFASGDEIDTWKKEAGKAGDTITQMLRRTSDFVFRKNILGGKPIGGEYDPEKEMDDSISVVNYWYQKGDMRERYLPCPHCDHLQKFEFEDMVWDKDKDKDGRTLKHYPETARFKCVECDEAIYDRDKLKMDEKGQWIAAKEFDGTASFRMWAMLSDSPNVTWPHIVKEFLTATKSKAKMKAFTNEVLARTWEEDYETTNTSDMMERREEYPAQVPDPVLILTMGADVQKDRIECEIIGWLNNYESYSIEYKKFFGDTTQPEVWETFREYILAKCWYREDGETMSVYAGCVDAGYLTDIVTNFCKPLYGKRIFPTQGHTSITAKINPGVVGRTKKNKNRIFTIGVNKAKDEIAWHIASKGGAGFMHFPVAEEYNDEYFKQLGSEKKEKNGRWIKTRNRNEVIDVRVYNYVALSLASVDLELLSHRGAMTDSSQIVVRKRRRVISKGIRR